MKKIEKPFEVMLAGKVNDVHDLQFPLLASPKLDGLRAHVHDGVVMSRNMKAFPNEEMQELFGVRWLHGIDGELISGPATADDAFRRTESQVMSAKKGARNLRFFVFDDYTLPALEFQARLRTAAFRIKQYADFKLVPHTIIADSERLLEYETKMVMAGYEGVMVRSMDGPYKYGRSTWNEGWLLKLKRFEDSEAVIIGVQEFMHNENERDADGKRSGHKAGKRAGGKLGSLLVRDLKTKVEFNVGSGFSDNDRNMFWAMRSALPGKIIRYKYFPGGSKTRPRFPTFGGFRSKIDI